MDRRRAAGVLLVLAACVAYATAAPTASNHTSLDLYDGAPDGCYYNFQHYGEGDRIMTNEPCLNCTCHNRMLMCYLRVCPFTKPIGQDCTIEKRADQCCPIVTCPDVPVDLLTSTTTSPAEYGATGLGKLDKYGCSIHGKYFPEGSKVPPTPNKPCEHCYCIRNMTTCVMQECTLHVDGCTPIYHKDVCCPVRYSCDHPEDEMPLLDDLSTTVRPTPGFLLTTTTLSPVTQMSQDCLYENQLIPDGALIKTEKACDHCYCMKGDIVCVVQECGTPMENEGKNCTALAPREGVCCPDTYICEGDEPTTGSYEGIDFTTELEQEKATTVAPHRRFESEGSGYRNEPDDIPNTQTPAFDTEPEGSGDEQATIHPTVVTDVLPDSHKIEPSDEISSSTGKINEFIPISTTRASVPEYEDVTTESNKGTPESQKYVPSTTSTYISQQSDELTTTKAQDEDIGSGEEEIVTPHEIIPSSSDLPVIEESEPTVPSEQHVATTESDKEADSDHHVKEPSTSMPTVYEDQTNLPKETDDSAMEIITETRPHLDEESFITEHVALRTTTSVPIIEESERKTTVSEEKDTTAIPFEMDSSKTFDPVNYSSATTSPPGLEDEIATTESQDVVTDSFEGTDFDPHNQITMTPSTPLLEEIEKETDEENKPVEGTSVEYKTSTTLSNIPTEEPIEKDSLKPDLIDETISTNIPSSDSELENDDMTTAEPQLTQDTDVEESSEPQQYASTTRAPAIEDDMKKTTTLDAIEPQKAQDIDVEESSEPPTTRASSFDDESKITTPLDSITSSEPQKTQSTDVEESLEPRPHALTTSAPAFDDESNKSTPSDATTSSESQKTQETDVEESSEPQQYFPTTSAPAFDDESKITTPSDAITSSEPQKTQEIELKESSEPQLYAPTTSAPAFDDASEKSTPTDAITSSESQKTQETDVEESSEPQQYSPTTSASAFDDESKITTPSDDITATEPQKTQEIDLEESSEPHQYAPTTSAPAFDGESEKSTPSDTITTFEPQRSQEAHVEENSEPQHYAPTTKIPTFDDESKFTSPSDALTTSEPQTVQETDIEESSEAQHYAPTTYAPEFDSENKKTTLLDAITTTDPQQRPESDEKISSVPQQYAPTTSAPVSDEEIKQTTPSDAMTNVSEDVDDHHEASSATTSEQSEITTAEPDKGLNTIPSGSIEDEITESPVVEKYTHAHAIVIDSATERENEASVETESITDKSKPTTSTSDTSASQEDQFTLTTEATEKENVESIASTETHDFAKQTTVSADISDEPSTRSPTSEYQESSTSLEPLSTESVEQTADSKEPITTLNYQSSTEATGPKDSTSDKHETITSSPSTAIIPESTTANLQDNEIINEPRIPGEGDCLLNGVTYRNESTVPSTNKCQSGCRCSSSIIKCDPIICSPPPEYMDNCQTTYDSPDSCCPTYVCDHKTETMPPQSHSQMSGTEAPIVSPVKCNGDECILSEDKNQSVETPISCESGSCTSTDKISSHPFHIPEQPVIDNNEGCIGDKCTPSDSTDQLCSEEKGCQASPVTPCEGNECEITHNTLPPQKLKPCANGDDCDVPVMDCSGGKCDLDADITQKKPHEKTCVNKEDCEDKLDIEKECTEKSCKKEDDSVLEQQPPKKCSGPDCQATDLISDKELTTEASSLETSQKEKELEAQTKSTDSLETVTETIEKSSELPAIDLDHTTRPIEDITEEPVQHKTTQFDHDSRTKPLPTTILPDITTQVPDLDSHKVEMSTIRESGTPSENQDITESPVPMTPEPTKVYDVEVNTESQTSTPAIYVTEKQDDTITETSDSSDISFVKDITTEIGEELNTHPPKTHLTEQQEVTKLPLDIDKQETTTMVVKESETEPTKIHDTKPQENEDITTNIPEVIFTAPPKSDHTELSFKPTEVEELTTKIADTITTVQPETSDTEPQEVTISSVGSQNEETTTKTYDSESQEVTKLPQENEDVGVTTKSTEDVGSTPSKSYDVDRQGTTETSGESQETTEKSVDEISTKPEIPNKQDTTKSPEITDSDEITKQSLEELTTESFKPYNSEEKDITKLPDIDSEEPTTSKIEDMGTNTQRPFDIEVSLETTQSSKETDSEEVVTKIPEEMVTETSKPYDTEIQEATPSSEKFEIVETTKKSDSTEPSILVNTEEQYPTKSPETIEVTTIEVTGETDKEPAKHDEIAHDTTVSQQDTDKEVTTSNIKEETGTESFKPDEFEPFGTTKSPNTFDSEETTATVTKISDIGPPKSDDSGSHPVTQSSEPESMTTSDIAIESHSLEKSTTSEPDTVPESTTPSILVPYSKSTEPERIDVSEITTGIQEQSQPTESATESIDIVTTASTETPIHKEDDITSILDQEIITKSPLDFTTKHEPHAEITTTTNDKTSDGETMLPEIEISTSDKTVTELPKEQDTEMPDEERRTTEAGVDVAEITQKPIPITTLDDDKSQEDAKTEVPILFETEKDTSVATTSKPSDATDMTYQIDLKTEQPETADSPKEEQPIDKFDKTTEITNIIEKTTTEQIIPTKLPVSFETVSENITEKPIIREPLATEPSKLDTTGKDELETEAPFVNKPITLTPEDEESLTETPSKIVKETDTTQLSDKDTKPSESEGETYTKTPLHSTSEAAEPTTPDIQIPESAEPSKVHTPSEITGSPELYTDRPFETTQKELSGPGVTEPIEVESSTNQEDAGDRETESIVPEIVQETSTKDQPPTDMHKLSTASPKETYTETSDEKVTTEGSVITETEKIYESVTESAEKVTKDTEINTSEQEDFEHSQPTTTEPANQTTKAQDQDDDENVEVATDNTTIKDSDKTPTSPSVLITTVPPETIETSTKLSEINTSQPEEDIEKSPGSEHITTSKPEISETTTRAKIEDESVSPVETESTGLPITSSDQQIVEIVTEPQATPIDTTTTKQETVSELVEDDLPSRTARPEMYSTTSSTVDESEKSTPSPVLVNESSTAPDQTMLTSIEPHVFEGEHATTAVLSAIDKASTPSINEIEVQTETVSTPTEKPLQPQPSPETSEPEEVKPTTAKAEEITTVSPVFDKFTKPAHKPTDAPATEQPRPIPTEEQPTDDLLTPDEEPSIPPSGTSGYGTDPDYMEEDQTFGPGTCRYGGKVYVSAQQIPRDDPCDFCFCFRSDIICLQQSCPPPIHGCHEEPISGFCCPRYECPVSMATTVNVTTTTTTTTTTLPPHFPVHSYKGSAQKRGCLIKGHTYKVGEVVRASSGPCLHCTCGGDGQMKCDPKQCTPEPMLRQMIAAAVSAKRRR